MGIAQRRPVSPQCCEDFPPLNLQEANNCFRSAGISPLTTSPCGFVVEFNSTSLIDHPRSPLAHPSAISS
jgi:hypothetical protein